MGNRSSVSFLCAVPRSVTSMQIPDRSASQTVKRETQEEEHIFGAFQQ